MPALEVVGIVGGGALGVEGMVMEVPPTMERMRPRAMMVWVTRATRMWAVEVLP